MKIISKIFLLTLILGNATNVYAQFNTVRKDYRNYRILHENKSGYSPAITLFRENIVSENKDSIDVKVNLKFCEIRLKERNKNYNRNTAGKLEGLTIESLYQEIVKNHIKHPKIVLAQAILETGWFRSSVCRNKGNLFGLRNPHTHDYYNFNDWRESVTAYYTKVQHRYPGHGNYLLWLKKIGYAEDQGYIEALTRVLKQL